MKKLTGLFFPCFLLLCCTGTAQTAAPLSKFHVQAGCVLPFQISSPYNTYKPNPVAFRVQLGANIGKGELYIAATHNYLGSDTLPPFTSSIFTLGYAHNVGIYKKTWLKPAVALGNHYMQFIEVNNTAHRNESELLLEASLHVQTALYKKLHLLGGVSYQRTMLYHRFDVWNTNVALVYYLNTPKFVKNLID